MQIRIQKRKPENVYIVIAILLFLFCTLKVIRGANTLSTREGGFWNYISLFYYAVAALGLVQQRTARLRAVFIAPSLYCVFAMLFSLVTSQITLQRIVIYSYLMIPYFFLVFLSFYFFAGKSVKGDRIIVLAYIVCLAVNLFTILSYLFRGGNRAVASDIYFSLCLFPFGLLFVKNKLAKSTMIALQFATTFLSNKRAGFIAFVLGMVVYYLTDVKGKGRDAFIQLIKKLLFSMAIIILSILISRYVDQQFNLGIYARLMRLGADDGSGRGDMYASLWQTFVQSDFLGKFIGHGLNTAGDVVGTGYAHNDFLEALYDFGVPACLCMILFYIALIVEGIMMIRRKSPYAATFFLSLVIGLTLSFFSYFLIYYTYVTCIVAFWGYVLKMEQKRLTQKTNVDPEEVSRAQTTYAKP